MDFDPVTMSCWARLHDERWGHPARKQVRNIRQNRFMVAWPASRYWWSGPRYWMQRAHRHPPRSDAYFRISRRSDAWVKAEMARYRRSEGVR